MRRPVLAELLLAGLLTVGLGTIQALEPRHPARVPLGLDAVVPVPPHNPLNAAKADLGRRLFFDARLSRDGTVACASCHVPERAFTDGRRVAKGIAGRRGRRNVPSLFNRAYGASQFWDGRATSLEEQVLEPLQDPDEMGMELGQLEARLRSINEYQETFNHVFGEDPTAANAAKAIATFARTLLSANSAFDRFEHGEEDALPAAARRGFDVFRDKGRCVACHVGPTLTDERFHNTGIAWRSGRFLDIGRFVITRNPTDGGAFKTPSLRNVALTAPYMHDGSLATLNDVINFYDQGGRSNPNLDEVVRPLGLTRQERSDLRAFLEALTSAFFARASSHAGSQQRRENGSSRPLGVGLLGVEGFERQSERGGINELHQFDGVALDLHDAVLTQHLVTFPHKGARRTVS